MSDPGTTVGASAVETTSVAAPSLVGQSLPPNTRSETRSETIPSPPQEPQTLSDTGLTDTQVDELVLKHLWHSGISTNANTSQQICLPRTLTSDSLERLREELLVAIKGSSGLHDYRYQLTEAGFRRARQLADRSTYVGAAPVSLADYRKAIAQQSLQKSQLHLARLQTALSDLTLQPRVLSQLAQALNDARGMFLFGHPGNGKTSIAQRLCRAYGECLWIPKLISIGGDLIRLFDPSCHVPIEARELEELKYDRRWILIKRPTVIVGGELTLEQLDPSYDPTLGISEAPVHLKANGGTFVVDDFGRQRVSPSELLNRLMVPLENHRDFLSLASGRQVEIPFELLFVISTNYEPRDLVEEAFLRRIPYKIAVPDPTADEFRMLFAKLAHETGFQVSRDAVDYLLEQHYKSAHRALRFCHARDLLRQMKNFCEVHQLPKQVDRRTLDVAVDNYFASL